jgi:DNA-binding beta-propeller fold protein YncE
MFRVKRIFVVLTALALGVGFGGFAAPAAGAPPVPSLMPGFPMQAGPVVMLMWGPVPGGVKYRIYLDDKRVGEAPMPPFQTTAPENAGEYRFTVTSLDASGAESEKSKPGVLRIIGLEPPKDVSGLFDTGNKQVVIRWGSAAGAMIYNLFRSEKEGEQGKLLQSLQDTRYVDKGVEANKKYYYRVTAKDATGKESKPSAQFMADTKVEVSTATETKIIKLVPIPTTVVGENKNLPNYPIDIQVLKDESIYLSMGSVVYLESFNSDAAKPLGEKFPGAMGLGATADGKLIIVQQGSNTVSVVDPVSGTVRLSFPVPDMKENFVFEGRTIPMGTPMPYDALQLSNGNFVVSDTVNNRVVLLDPRGKFLNTCGKDKDQHVIPGASFLALSPKGDIYAVSGASNRVVIFDGDCNYKGGFGEPGNAVGTFGRVQGIDVDPSGSVWVVDMMSATVQKFSPSGEFLGVLTDTTKKANVPLNTPVGLFVKPGGKDLFVAEGSTKRVKQLRIQE